MRAKIESKPDLKRAFSRYFIELAALSAV